MIRPVAATWEGYSRLVRTSHSGNKTGELIDDTDFACRSIASCGGPDLVDVGCIVDSCKRCDDCSEGLENYCNHMVGTCNGPAHDAPGHTLGGYSQQIVVHERYVLRISHSAEQLAAVAPLLCAGITAYSPLRHWNVGSGHKVGVVGIGGLGHMDIKLAHAMGAHEVVVSRNAEEMAAITYDGTPLSIRFAASDMHC